MSGPSGILTFLFTDIEGSTQLWEQYLDRMGLALSVHDRILRNAIEEHRGVVFKTGGDSFHAVFHSPADGLAAAHAAQIAMAQQSWEIGPILVRMALHTGTAEHRDGDYFGPAMNRAARILDLVRGGHAVCSQESAVLAGDPWLGEGRLVSLGRQTVRDFGERELFAIFDPRLPRSGSPLREQSSPVGNLPKSSEALYGRESELADIEKLVDSHRLVTLTGTGGIGKTRLAIETARSIQERFPDGVWLVEMEALTSGAFLAPSIARTLSLHEAPGESSEQSVLAGLAGRRSLLVLDNCEHLIDAAADLANSVLRSCPHIRIIATSREPLDIAGEQIYRVSSLRTPAVSERLEEVGQCASVRLFVHYVSLGEPGFRLDASNGGAVALICRELDGIPLALELAAARARALPIEKVASRIKDRFRLLTGTSRSARPRQQTLKALIDWSYDLLNPAEQALLRSLAVFNGGWDLDAVETVAPQVDTSIDSLDAIDLLQSLIDKSLVIAEPLKDRYSMLATVRQYAMDRLQGSGALDRARSAHARYYLAFVETQAGRLKGADQIEAGKRIDEQHENLRSALDTFVEFKDGEAAQRLAGTLYPYWDRRGLSREGLERSRLALSLDGAQAHTRALLLIGAGKLSFLQADYATAASFHLAATEADPDDPSIEAEAFTGLGQCKQFEQSYEEAEEILRRALERRKATGDRHGEGLTLHCLGNVKLRLQQFDQAAALFDEALKIRREAGDLRNIAGTLGGLSQVAMERGNYEEANRLTREALSLFIALDIRWVCAICFRALRDLSVREGRMERATVLNGAMIRVRQLTNFNIPPAERETFQAADRGLEEEMGSESYRHHFDVGYTLPWEKAVEYALEAQP